MSQHQAVLGAPLQRNHRPLPIPACSKSKRLRTKRERNAAKFGAKIPLRGSRRGPTIPPRWLQPPPWAGGLFLGSPLGPPKPVVITQNRLCHRGLFNHKVKSLDVRRLLTPGPGGDAPHPTPPVEEGDIGGVPAEALKDLVASLASLLGSFGAFPGRELVRERRRSLMAVLRRHRRGPPDLGVFLAHRTPAQASGQKSPRAPQQEERSEVPEQAVNLGGWEVGDPPARTPSPLRHVNTPPPPPCTPSPIFGDPRKRENPFSWSSVEDEEDETPGGPTHTWGAPGGLLPAPFWRPPQPPQKDEGEDEGWTPITAPAFSPDAPPWGPPPMQRHPWAPPCPQMPSDPKNLENWDPLGPLQVPLECPKTPLGFHRPTPNPPQTPLGTLKPHPSSPHPPPDPPGPPKSGAQNPTRPPWTPSDPSGMPQIPPDCRGTPDQSYPAQSYPELPWTTPDPPELPNCGTWRLPGPYWMPRDPCGTPQMPLDPSGNPLTPPQLPQTHPDSPGAPSSGTRSHPGIPRPRPDHPGIPPDARGTPDPGARNPPEPPRTRNRHDAAVAGSVATQPSATRPVAKPSAATPSVPTLSVAPSPAPSLSVATSLVEPPPTAATSPRSAGARNGEGSRAEPGGAPGTAPPHPSAHRAAGAPAGGSAAGGV
ncbi:basic proline-rich protein-like [Hirundo rustica]|uniref:basic proline-rich protein-like n=1 Tax=Hirundo rustica TaxID=43150 RepID=UPI001A94EDA6|nr:basic proline-rich protein-like [Hirundo rustica]